MLRNNNQNLRRVPYCFFIRLFCGETVSVEGAAVTNERTLHRPVKTEMNTEGCYVDS